MEAVFGVDERNKSSGNCVSELPKNMRNAAISDIQCRSLFTSVPGKCTDIYRKIAMVNDFDSSFGYRNLRIISLPFVNLCRGKTPGVTQKNETGDFQYP